MEYAVILLILIISICISIVIFAPRKKYIVSKFDGVILVNKDIQLEESDIQYYHDLKSEFDKRKSLYYHVNKNPEVVNMIIEDDIYIPDNIDYHLDTQNVHDTMIQDNLKNKMKNVQFARPVSTVFKEIEKFSNYDHEVSGVLNDISNRNGYLSNFSCKEADVIAKVWTNSDDLVKDELLVQLKDCKENGMLVCPTGVASRVSSSLYINDPSNAPKSKAILNQEILNKFSKLYEENQDKDEVTREVAQSYSGVYSEKKINDIISEWVDFI